MLFTAILAAMLSSVAEEEEEPSARDLSFSLELTGFRQLGASGFVDYGVIPGVVYLNAGYTLLKTPALPSRGMSPEVPTSPTHTFSAGADWTPGRHLSLSLLFSGSPKAGDKIALLPLAPAATRITVGTWRSSVGGSLLAAWASGRLSNFEWVVDGGLSITNNRLGHGVARGNDPEQFPMPREDENLFVYRALGGVTFTFFDRTDVSVRGGYSAYSSDPLTAGRFDEAEVLLIRRALDAVAKQFTHDLEALSRASQQASARLGQADSLSGYASAPLLAEAKVTVRHRFTSRFSAQLGWTYNRYVPTAGHSNILSSRLTFRLDAKWRLWGGGAVQRDQPLDHPAQRVEGDPEVSISGLVTVGVELTL